MSNIYMNNAYIYKSQVHMQTYYTTHIYYESSLFFCYDNYPLKYNCHKLYKHEFQTLLKYLYEN